MQPLPPAPAAGQAQPAAHRPAAPAPATPASSNGTASPQQSQDALAQAKQALSGSNRALEFVVDKSTGRMVVKVVDSQTGQVLKQIPDESMLATARALSSGKSTGALVDQRA